MKYGETIIHSFDIEKDLELWPNEEKQAYTIHIELPEFTCLCPRSGYPDFATINISYVPDQLVVELKALKLYINTFRDQHISHEKSANTIYNLLYQKLHPKYLYVKADFYPRGNVHTVIEIDSSKQNY